MQIKGILYISVVGEAKSKNKPSNFCVMFLSASLILMLKKNHKRQRNVVQLYSNNSLWQIFKSSHKNSNSTYLYFQ